MCTCGVRVAWRTTREWGHLLVRGVSRVHGPDVHVCVRPAGRGATAPACVPRGDSRHATAPLRMSVCLFPEGDGSGGRVAIAPPIFVSRAKLKPRYRTPGLGSPGISAAPRDGPGRSRARSGSRAPWAVSSLSTSVTLPNSSRVANKTTFLSATCACVPSSASGQPAVVSVHLWQPEKSWTLARRLCS